MKRDARNPRFGESMAIDPSGLEVGGISPTTMVAFVALFVFVPVIGVVIMRLKQRGEFWYRPRRRRRRK